MGTRCPECGSGRVRSASRRGNDGLHRALLYRPLRCRECRHRFWKFNIVKPLLLLATLGMLVGGTAWLARAQRMPAAADAPQAPNGLAERGDRDAQFWLGMRYAEGDGIVPNPKQAAKWFALAAQQGHTQAQYQYGLALLNGKGVVQDYRLAFAWIEKAAQQDYALAQHTLGELYRFGTGVATDKARAYLWFNLAAAQGFEAAGKARDQLAMQLKPEQIMAMQDEARRMAGPGASTTAQADPSPPVR